MIGWRTWSSLLWRIERTGGGALTNERSQFIQSVGAIGSTPNPIQIPRGMLYGVLTFHQVVDAGANITAVRVYASHTNVFPPAGSTEYNARLTTNLAVSQAIIRLFEGQADNAGQKMPLRPIPEFLLLEYDMTAAGAGESQMDVTGQFMGPEITGKG